MSDNSAFAQALHNFTMDAAAGDAIRYLTDKGYTLPQIKDTISFPAPAEYIEKIMWDRLVRSGKVLFEDPASRSFAKDGDLIPSGSDEIVEHRDRYGHKSFLRVKKESPEEIAFSPEDYVSYKTVWVIKHAQEQVSSLSDRILPKVRSTGSHRDM